MFCMTPKIRNLGQRCRFRAPRCIFRPCRGPLATRSPLSRMVRNTLLCWTFWSNRRWDPEGLPDFYGFDHSLSEKWCQSPIWRDGARKEHHQYSSFILSYSDPELVLGWYGSGGHLWIFVSMTICKFLKFWKKMKFEHCHARVFMTSKTRFFFHKIWCFAWLRKFEILAREVVSEHLGVFFRPCRGPLATRSRPLLGRGGFLGRR